MTWKNGGGSTSQIQIFPQDADPAGESFLWRLSSAAVTDPGPFSLFKGYDRWLVILRGDGLVLTEQIFNQKSRLNFLEMFRSIAKFLATR